MIDGNRVAVWAGCLTAILCGGCELFPPTPTPPQGGATRFATATEGVLGAAQAYIVGVTPEFLDGRPLRDLALAVSLGAQNRPQRVDFEPGQEIPTADLNGDGFLTLDEVIALAGSGATGEGVASAIRATGFELIATRAQFDHMRAFGVPEEALTPFPPPPDRRR